MLTSLPAPRDADLRPGPVLRWAILGPGEIAHDFADAALTHTDQRIVAIGSRSGARAEALRARLGLDVAIGSYDEVISRPDVDIVYVAVPHPFHADLALRAIAAGKHVLVEKPFTMNAAEAQEIRKAARAAGVLVMEAMWTRYLPQTDILRQLVSDAIGELTTVDASFGGPTHYDPAHRAFSPALGGGALLDIGIYPLSYIWMLLGAPRAITATGTRTELGVDADATVLLSYPTASATFRTSLRAVLPGTATISGSTGMVTVGPLFLMPSQLEFVPLGGELLSWHTDRSMTGRGGLCYQAVAAARYVAEGRTESPLLPLDESVAIMEAMDTIRAGVPDWTEVSLSGEDHS